MENLQEKPRSVVPKPVNPVLPQRSPAVQRKLDEANEDLAKLSQESLDLLFPGKKNKPNDH